MEDSWQQLAGQFRGDTPETIESVFGKFKKALGRERVSLEGNALRLTFNIKDEAEFFQFNHLPSLLIDKKIQFASSVEGETNALLQIPLNPKAQMDMTILADMANRLTVQVVGDEKAVIARVDPMHPIVVATQVPWNVVHGSPYGVDTLEPVRDNISVDDKRRIQEEFAVGFALHDDDGKTKETIDEWLGFQHQVEARKGVSVHTAIPKEWATSDKTHRGRLLQQKESLSRLFSSGSERK